MPTSEQQSRLTWRGFQRKQHPIVLQMLQTFGVHPESIRLISSSTNFIYSLHSGGEKYVLRLAFPGWRSVEDARAETTWLDALGRDTDIPVPRILRTRSGEPVAQIEERHAVLMTWLPGMLLGRRLNPQNLSRMGELFAKLHLHSAGWVRPAGFPQKTFDRLLARGEPEALFTAERLPEYTVGDLEVIGKMAERVNMHYESFDRADLRVIHCDLWHDNIKLYRGVLAPFDFEDTIIGYRLHDIAMAMLDLAEDAGVEAYYGSLLPAFRSGYERLLLWPEGEMEILQMGRMLWKLNWTAQRAPERFPAAAVFTAELFRRHERSGRLVEPLRH